MSWLRWAVPAAVVVTAAWVAAVAAGDGASSGVLLAQAWALPAALWAAVALLHAGRRSGERAWTWLATAALWWAAARGADGLRFAQPAIDLARALAAAAAGYGLLVLPTAAGGELRRVRVLLDGLLVAAPVLFAGAVLLGAGTHVGPVTAVRFVLPAAAGVVTLSASLAVANRVSIRLRPALTLCAAGVAALTLGDALLAAVVMRSGGIPEVLPWVAWSAGGLLLAVAGLRVRDPQADDDGSRAVPDDPLAATLPYVFLLVGLPVWLQRALSGADEAVLSLGVVYLALVIARQLLGEREHRALRARFSTNVLELQEHAERSAFLAHHDALTGLPNRSLFGDRLRQSLTASARSGSSVAVLLVDLDHFKEINDTLGHHMGDALLRLVGPRVLAELREVDTLARLGGDEFVVLLPDVAGTHAAMRVAERLLVALQRPFRVEGLTLTVEASIGVALAPEHAGDELTLLQRADVALYVAKEMRGVAEVYDPALDEHDVSRLTLVADLRSALYAQQLVVNYQPMADLRSGRIVGVEALVHWPHATRGVLPPGDFIPAAEQTGLIKPLTLFVLEQSLRQVQAWRTAGHELTVSVNLSARTLLDLQLADEVAALLARCRVPAQALEFEITESTMMVDPGRARQVLERVSALGVGIAVDDYGTGYSSLAYLSRLPINALKIDRSFVATMERDECNGTIVRSTIDLAHNLGLRVVAEGVESGAIWRRLAELGCDLAQGYHLSGAVPAAAILELLARRARQAPTSAAP